MSLSEVNQFEVGDILDWIEQRQKYQRDQSLEQWRIMRTLATIVVNLVSKRQVKEEELFKLGDEAKATERTPEEMKRINELFDKWDKT